MNLTRRHKGAKGAKMRLLRCYSRFLPRHSRFLPRHSRFLPCHFRFLPHHSRFLPCHFRYLPPSFPRKRESTHQQRHPRESGDKFAILNQVQIAASGSPLPLWACRGRFWGSGWQTTFTPSGGGGHGSGSSQTRRHILPLVKKGGSASPCQGETRSRYDCAPAPLSAATAARPDSVSAPGRPPPGCRKRASAA